MADTESFTVFAPGRVNLIGDHTDYMGGLALPMAIPMGITIGARHSDHWHLTSTHDAAPLVGPAGKLQREHVPRWAAYVTAVAQVAVDSGRLPANRGLVGTVTSTLPPGVGLSSSAALEVAAALALGVHTDSELQLAELCQSAETHASGVPCGIMDQWAIIAGRAGLAMRIDFRERSLVHVPIPPEATISIVHSGQERWLGTGEYEQRRRECEQAEAQIGPLVDATTADRALLTSAALRRRANHVFTECARVDEVVAAFKTGDLRSAGRAMSDSHRSLSDDFEVSTPHVDDLVEAICAHDSVYGARMTGAGFGGCVVVLHSMDDDISEIVANTGTVGQHTGPHFTVQASDGAAKLALDAEQANRKNTR